MIGLALIGAACLAVTVHDGDTIRCGDERVRVSNIDAPELRGSPRCNPRRLVGGLNPSWCDYALGEQSRAALAAFLSRGRVTIYRRGQDRHGRTLATLEVDGRDAGAHLIDAGLAREWRK
jgi:endonuclease YncB( thermonuclease family)